MDPVPVGSRIRIISNDFNHTYRIGGIYTVSYVDGDGTLKAADANGRVGNWLRWSECAPCGASTWERIAADLPEPLVRFLACFDGIGQITVQERVVDAVLARLPDLHDRILAAASTPAGEAAITGNIPLKQSP
ncbi:MAG: hypothetical protein ACKO4T_13610 [Planctomycetaceae bacterium]